MPMALIASMTLKCPLAIDQSFHGVPLMSRVTCLHAMMTTSKFTLDVYLIRNLSGNFALKTVKYLLISTLLIDAYNLCLKLTVLVVVKDSTLIMKAFVKVTMYTKGKFLGSALIGALGVNIPRGGLPYGTEGDARRKF